MTSKCALCRNPVDPAHAPFCSMRCKDRDLMQWLGEGYRIPGASIDPDGLDTERQPD